MGGAGKIQSTTSVRECQRGACNRFRWIGAEEKRFTLLSCVSYSTHGYSGGVARRTGKPYFELKLTSRKTYIIVPSVNQGT